MPAGREEAALGVLGVHPDLDRRARSGRRSSCPNGQPLARRYAQLELDQVDAVHQLGDRVLDLQSRVHLHEEELVGTVGRDDELDGTGARRSRTPAPLRPPERPIPARISAVSSGDGASSTIFWWRRCRLHSRSPRCTTLPCSSASTWISMWRGLVTNRSTSRVSSPNDATRFAAGRRDRSGELVIRLDQPHALAAAARRWLEQHREPDVAGRL